MNYLCPGKEVNQLTEEQLHDELKKGWTVFNNLIGSVYKDAIWDDLNSLARRCICDTNEVKLAMKKLVQDSPKFF